MSQYIDNTTNRMPNESQILKLRNCQYIYNLVAKIYNIRKLSAHLQLTMSREPNITHTQAKIEKISERRCGGL